MIDPGAFVERAVEADKSRQPVTPNLPIMFGYDASDDPDGVLEEATAAVLARLPEEDRLMLSNPAYVRVGILHSPAMVLRFRDWPKNIVLIDMRAIYEHWQVEDSDERAEAISECIGAVAHEFGHIKQTERNPHDDCSEASANWWAYERGFPEVDDRLRWTFGPEPSSEEKE